jgi:hypothetical protein
MHGQVSTFIDVVCINNDATAKTYLSHCFADLDLKEIPCPANSKGEPKTSTRDDKGQLTRDHNLVMTFLANLCQCVHLFANYLYALKPLSKTKSEMNDVDCLQLKRNYAWWIFTGASLTYDEFKNSAMSHVLHHFNNHLTCETWCLYRN